MKKALRGFEVAKGYEDKDIHIPIRKTAHAAGYDIEAAEDVLMPKYKPGIKPTLIPTGLKAYCQPDECYFLLNRSSGPKKGFLMANGIGLIDSDYYENEDNDGHIMFSIINLKEEDLYIKKGDAVGQAMFGKYLKADNDKATNVRIGGFGSTTK